MKKVNSKTQNEGNESLLSPPKKRKQEEKIDSVDLFGNSIDALQYLEDDEEEEEEEFLKLNSDLEE